VEAHRTVGDILRLAEPAEKPQRRRVR
jgi:hypothetical protein